MCAESMVATCNSISALSQRARGEIFNSNCQTNRTTAQFSTLRALGGIRPPRLCDLLLHLRAWLSRHEVCVCREHNVCAESFMTTGALRSSSTHQKRKEKMGLAKECELNKIGLRGGGVTRREGRLPPVFPPAPSWATGHYVRGFCTLFPAVDRTRWTTISLD